MAPVSLSEIRRRLCSADPSVSEEEQLGFALHHLLQVTKEKLAREAPSWRSGRSSRPKVPSAYFEPFASKAVENLFAYFSARAQEQLTLQQQRLNDSMQMYLQETHAFKDRQSQRLAYGKDSEMEEELYIFEPLRYFEAEQQRTMREIINERLRAILHGWSLRPPQEEEEEEEEIPVPVKGEKSVRKKPKKIKPQPSKPVLVESSDDDAQDLLQTLQELRKSAEEAEAERDALAQEKAALDWEVSEASEALGAIKEPAGFEPVSPSSRSHHSIDPEAAYRRALELAMAELQKKLAAEELELKRRIEKLELDISALKEQIAAVSLEPPKRRKVKQVAERKASKPKPPSPVRGIFERLHKDAAKRVTRMICRRDEYMAEHEAIVTEQQPQEHLSPFSINVKEGGQNLRDVSPADFEQLARSISTFRHVQGRQLGAAVMQLDLYNLRRWHPRYTAGLP